jgi:N-methylhydantoinase B/oxoprolinase/acetone carboxylase alpha subunit
MFSTFDRQLRTLAQAFAQPSHLGSPADIVPRAIAAYGAEHLKPGDGLLVNDPCLGGVHLNLTRMLAGDWSRPRLREYVLCIWCTWERGAHAR